MILAIVLSVTGGASAGAYFTRIRWRARVRALWRALTLVTDENGGTPTLAQIADVIEAVLDQ